MRCKNCGKELDAYDVGLHRKLIGRESRECMCISCLAEYFSVTEELLRRKITEFVRAGCMLFPPPPADRK